MNSLALNTIVKLQILFLLLLPLAIYTQNNCVVDISTGNKWIYDILGRECMTLIKKISASWKLQF